MIRRLLTAVAVVMVVAVVAMVIGSIPDIKRYLEIREM